MAATKDAEDEEWQVTTAKMLNRTLPFDTQKAILFVREGEKTRAECGIEDESISDDTQEKLSGTEAKRFYEDILAMPEQSNKGCGRKRKRSRHKKRLQVNEHSKKHRSNCSHSSPASVGQVFQCVQDGDLEGLRTALSSGTCNVNTTDHFHWTLLMSAAHAGHMHLVKYLLELGAKWRGCVDKSGCNAVDLARVAGHLSIACLIETYDDSVIDKLECVCVRTKGSREAGHKPPHHKSTTSTYYCDVCKQNVTENFTDRHTTSTVHQFCCQHKPSAHNYTIPQTNRGYQMMLRSGWDPQKGLGSEQEGQKYPVKTILKQDRLGFGQDMSEGRARVTHFAAFDERAVRTRPKSAPALRKKDIIKAAQKDREWEVRMRRYMNTEREYGSHS